MDAPSDAASVGSLEAIRASASSLESHKKGRAKKGRRRVQAPVNKKSFHSNDEIPSLDDQPALGSSDDEVESLGGGRVLASIIVPAHEKLARKAVEYAQTV